MTDMNHTAALRLAFVGGGINSAVGRAHFAACRMDGRFQLYAGCFSRHVDTNKQSGAQYGVVPERIYRSGDDLINGERQNLDAIVVLTPTPDHKDIVIKALRANVPVFCEKALTATLEDVEAVRHAEQSSAGFLAVSYNYTGYPMLRELRALVLRGHLGALLHLNADMPQEGFIRHDAQGKPFPIQAWRLNDGPIPGVHLDLGVHLHQIVHYLTGLAPKTVFSTHACLGSFDNVIDYVVAQIEYERGIHATYSFGKSMLGHRNGLRVRLYGEKASAEWTQVNPEELRIFHKNGTIETIDRGSDVSIANSSTYSRFKAGHPAGYIEAFANIYGDLHDCLTQFRSAGSWQSEEIFGSELAGCGLEFLHAMARSAEKKERLSVHVLP